MPDFRVLCVDALEGLRSLPDGVARCCVTSPPYWGLRDYKSESQIGLERTSGEYTHRLVAAFQEVRRVLTDDGTLWLNLGDCYYSGNRGGYRKDAHRWERSEMQRRNRGNATTARPNRLLQLGLKGKDLVGVPWMIAFALRADGWWLRSEIIWHKTAPMPERVTDRPTRAHEQIFLLSKAARYYYDHEAVREPLAGTFPPNHPRSTYSNATHHEARPPGASAQTGLRLYRAGNGFAGRQGGSDRVGPQDGGEGSQEKWEDDGTGRNLRSVWTLGPEPFHGAHFATFPTALVDRCIKAGSAEGDTVLDPFCGSGTTGVVACRINRNFVGIELNHEYAETARLRIGDDAPLLNRESHEERRPLDEAD